MALVVAAIELSDPTLCEAYCSVDGSEDTWFADPLGHAPPEPQTKQTKVEFVARVLDYAQEQAQRALRSSAFVELSRDEAARLTGADVPEPHGKHFFLLRGLAYSRPGNFLVNEFEDAVTVTFAFLGNPSGGTVRTTIVALLRAAPKTVYVTCSGAI